ncbi:MAG: hypothetical protein KDJ16_02785 [Hyphomicrobiales bacterium]|nr:hypothetical protein [Hyphomicrobiales bacterium]
MLETYFAELGIPFAIAVAVGALITLVSLFLFLVKGMSIGGTIVLALGVMLVGSPFIKKFQFNDKGFIVDIGKVSTAAVELSKQNREAIAKISVTVDEVKRSVKSLVAAVSAAEVANSRSSDSDAADPLPSNTDNTELHGNLDTIMKNIQDAGFRIEELSVNNEKYISDFTALNRSIKAIEQKYEVNIAPPAN